MIIASNLRNVQKKIEQACFEAGRDPTEVKLIAVTKNISVARIKEAIDQGVTDIGENRVQEVAKKIELLGAEDIQVNWHFVGHLQRNKVKYIIDSINLIHSLDNPRLAEEIDKRAEQKGKVQNVLVQVNFSEDANRFGFLPAETKDFLKEASKLKHISIQGLMTMAPLASAERVRLIFARSKSFFEELKSLKYPYSPMRYLSMGMSNDFEIAIKEGSNMVRIGTAIFRGADD